MNVINRQFPLVIICCLLSSHSFAGDVLTYHNNNARTGLNPNETTLTPQNVNAASFGLLRNLPVDGQVYAQPLYVSNVTVFSAGQPQGVHNLLIVATEHDSVYAFDADSGKLYWHSSMLGSGEVPSDSRNCSDLTPEIGITATPVIDRGAGPHGTIFVVAISKTPDSSSYFARLHAVDLATGQDVLTPTVIQATYPDPGGHGPLNDGKGHVVFDPRYERNRAGLALSNGLIYTAWALIYCEHLGAGWVIAFDENTLNQHYWLTTDPDGTPTSPNYNLPNGSGAGIWMSGAAPAVDSAGNLYVPTGNGPFDTTLSTGDFGESVLKLSPTVQVLDHFTPFDYQNDAIHDLDMASGGTMLLDMTDGANRLHHLLITAGKDTNLYVLNRDNLGQFNAGTNNVYQELHGALPSGVWGSPAYFNGSVYYGAGNGDFGYGPLQQFPFNANAQLNPASSRSSEVFIMQGGPCISSSGNTNGIVWASEYVDSAPPVLHAYDALNLGNELYRGSASGISVKYVSPTVCNGKVFVGAANSVAVFGLFNPPPATPPSVAKDFDNDGQADLVWENSATGQRGLWILKNGVLSQIINLPTIPTQWHIAGVGDFLGTGQAGLAWENTVTGQRGLWILRKGALSQIINLPTIPTQWHIAGVGDFLGTGQAGLAWENTVTGQRGLWILRKGALSQIINLPTIPTQWHIAGVGDFLGTGQAGLAWENTITGQRGLWILRNGVLSQIINLPTIPTQWHIAGAGDFLGTGQAGLAWENTVTGQRGLWILRNGVLSQIINLPTIPTQWHIEDH